MILFNKPIRFHISGLPAKSLINNLNSFAPFQFSPLEPMVKFDWLKLGLLNLQPCGGTHVANTKEIGEFKFIKYDSKGKMNKRVKFTLN